MRALVENTYIYVGSCGLVEAIAIWDGISGTIYGLFREWGFVAACAEHELGRGWQDRAARNWEDCMYGVRILIAARSNYWYRRLGLIDMLIHRGVAYSDGVWDELRRRYVRVGQCLERAGFVSTGAQVWDQWAVDAEYRRMQRIAHRSYRRRLTLFHRLLVCLQHWERDMRAVYG